MYAVLYDGFEEFICCDMCWFWRIYMLWYILVLKNLNALVCAGFEESIG